MAYLKTSILLIVLVMAVFCQESAKKTKLDKNVMATIQKVELKEGLRFSVAAGVGIDSNHHDRGVYQQFTLDLGFNDVYVPDGKNGPFGMTCDQKDGCFAKDTTQECPYGIPAAGNLLSCVPASAFFRFSNSSLKDTNVAKLNFKLVKGDDKYADVYSQKGVLGLGPNSPYWSYLLNTFEKSKGQDYIDTSLYFNLERQLYAYDSKKSDFSSSHLVLNGRYTTTSQAVIGMPQGSLLNKNYWEIPNITVKLLNREIQTKNVCVDNSTQKVFYFTNQYQPLMKQINQKLCGKDSGCKKHESKVKDVEESVFTFKGSDATSVVIKIPGSDLISWAEDDTAIVGIQDTSASPACSTSEIAFGALFFTLVELTIRVRDGPAFEISISKNNSPNGWIYVLCFIILVADIAFIAVCTTVARNLLRKYKIIDENLSHVPTTEDHHDHQHLTDGVDIKEH